MGFEVINQLSEYFSIKLKKPFFKSYSIGEKIVKNVRIILIKPLTFMNLSGIILPKLLLKKKFK